MTLLLLITSDPPSPPAATFTGEATVTAEAPRRTVNWSAVDFTAEGHLDAYPGPVLRGGIVPATGKARRIEVCGDVDGTTIADLTSARMGPITWERNQPEQWSFTMPADDPKGAFVLDVHLREAKLWRGDLLMSWGPMTRPAVAKDYLAVQGQGAGWHLARRTVGPARRRNYIHNGDFEDGTAGWAFYSNPVQRRLDLPGAQPTPPYHDIVRYPTVTGRRALRLQNYITGADACAFQNLTWTVDVDASPLGDRWVLAGWLWVESFHGPASEARGLYLERFSTTELNPNPTVQAIVPGAKKSLQRAFVPLTADTPRRTWVRFEIELTTPPKAGEPETLHVLLYAPNGVVYWDDVELALDKHLVLIETDQAAIAEALVTAAQDPDDGWTDLNITPVCPRTGVLRTRAYRYADRPVVADAIDEFTALDNGIDWAMNYTPTERRFTTYSPARGRRRARAGLELGKNVADIGWSFDGESAATQIVTLGTGDGAARDEGVAIDASGFAGGLSLIEVFTASEGNPVDSLDNLAAERLAVARNPEVLAIKPTPNAVDDFIGIVWPGDTVPVTITKLPLDIAADYRIERMTLNEDDSIDFVLNRRV